MVIQPPSWWSVRGWLYPPQIFIPSQPSISLGPSRGFLRSIFFQGHTSWPIMSFGTKGDDSLHGAVVVGGLTPLHSSLLIQPCPFPGGGKRGGWQTNPPLDCKDSKISKTSISRLPEFKEVRESREFQEIQDFHEFQEIREIPESQESQESALPGSLLLCGKDRHYAAAPDLLAHFRADVLRALALPDGPPRPPFVARAGDGVFGARGGRWSRTTYGGFYAREG